VANPLEIIERGHFQVGTRQRRGKFLANRVAIFSNRWMRRKRPSLLKSYVQESARDWTALVPSARRARDADDGLLYINAEVEPEA
jgi:hypothetical protein